jgi:hypothetical protein
MPKHVPMNVEKGKFFNIYICTHKTDFSTSMPEHPGCHIWWCFVNSDLIIKKFYVMLYYICVNVCTRDEKSPIFREAADERLPVINYSEINSII